MSVFLSINKTYLCSSTCSALYKIVCAIITVAEAFCGVFLIGYQSKSLGKIERVTRVTLQHCVKKVLRKIADVCDV